MRVFAVFTFTAAAVAGWHAEEGLAADPSASFPRKFAADDQRATNEGSDGGWNTSPLAGAMKHSRRARKVTEEEGDPREARVRKEVLEGEDEDQIADSKTKKEEQRRPTYPPRSVGYYLQRRALKRKKKNGDGGKKTVEGAKKNVHPLSKRASSAFGEH
ncbi:hypothetical protein Emed_000378 [Eimeria media]